MGRRFLQLIRSFVDIRPGEWGMAALMFTYLLLVIGTFSVVKPVRSSLFLQQFGAKNLPYIYIATAVFAGIVAAIHARLFRRFAFLWVQSLTYLFFIASLLFFWWALRQETVWVSAAFFLWTNLFTITLNTLFWIFANNFYSPREAKRLYGFINSGGTIGGIAGGLAVSQLVTFTGTENLLLWCAGVLGVCILLASVIARMGKERFAAREHPYVGEPSDPRDAPTKAESAQPQTLFGTPYPRYIAAALGLSLVISVIVDYQFNSMVEQTYQQTDAMTAFFGSFSAWLNALTFVLQFFVTSTLLRRAGIGASLLVLPFLMLSGSAIFAFFPALASAIFLKVGDSGVRYSIEQSTRDVLYLPLPNMLMKRLKSFVDVFVQRLAKGVGSLLILAFTSWLALGFRVLAFVSVALAVGWILLALVLRKEYVEELRRFLGRGQLQAEPKFLRRLDSTTTAELLNGLESGDDKKALYCLDLLEQAATVDIRLVLRKWAREGSPALQSRALHMLAEVGDPTLVSAAERILEVGSPEAKEEAIHYLCGAHTDPMEKMQQLLESADTGVRAAALACLANCGGAQGQMMAGQLLEQMVRGKAAGENTRKLAARTLRHVRSPSSLHSQLIPLLQDESCDVVREALAATESVLRRDLIPFIVPHLQRPETSEAAYRALNSHGEAILGTLRDYLNDPGIPLEIRQRLPAVFVQGASEKAAWDLVASLDQEETPLRHSIIKALSKMRSAHQDIKFPGEEIGRAIRREAADAFNCLRDLHLYVSRTSAPEGEDPVEEVGKHKQRYEESVERIFRLLGLLFEPRDIFHAYRGLNSTQLELQSSALEFLDNLLPPDLGALILPLVDESIPLEEKLKVGDSLVRSEGAASFAGPRTR